MRQPALRLGRLLGSLRLTLPLMVLMVVGVLLTYRVGGWSVWWTVSPLLLLAVNLAAALIVMPRFRRQWGLLVFHLSLLASLLLAAYGELTSLAGRVEIVVGQEFAPELVMVDSRGPWHELSRLERVSFTQGPFQVEYAPQLVRGATRSNVYPVAGADPQTVGDRVPLRQAGYRFSTTPNKGVAALIRWSDPANIGGQTGAVHFPSYPLKDWDQRANWTTPGGEELVLNLKLQKSPPVMSEWVLDSSLLDGAFVAVVDDKGNEWTLRPGDQIDLAGQRIQLLSLNFWIGYEVFYHAALPWMLAAALVAVFGIGWHFWSKFRVQRAAGEQSVDIDNRGLRANV